jgi:hypothetical protein
MGMIGKFAAVRPKQLQSLIDETSRIVDFLFFKEVADKPNGQLDIDKAWQGIHFLLTGEPYSNESFLAKAIFGGEEVGDDLGFGSARYLTPEEVNEVAAALRDVSKEDLVERYIPRAFEEANIYPSGIWESEGSVALDYLLSNYESMVAFYELVAARGDAMLLYIV